MRHLAQRGTDLLALALCLLASCATARTGSDAGTETRDSGADTVPVSGRPVLFDGSVPPLEGGGGACKKRSDCQLVPERCCTCPASEPWSFVVTTKAEAHSMCAGVSCAACPAEDRPPLAPVYVADCIKGVCTRVDLRKTERSKCSSDADCTPVALGCCGAYSAQTVEYVGLRPDADTTILQCEPAPPCVPSSPHGEPSARCAVDRHCSISRRLPTDEPEPGCYSPTQNIEHAYDTDAFGCACAPVDSGVCVHEKGRDYALICDDYGRWRAVEDGPCSRGP
jgi:hypothetical protein